MQIQEPAQSGGMIENTSGNSSGLSVLHSIIIMMCAWWLTQTFFSSRVSRGVLGGACGTLVSLVVWGGGRGSSGRPPQSSARDRVDDIAIL